MKLTFGIIVLNGDFFLRQVLESIYPYAHAICIAHGPVRWWMDHGVYTSADDTLKIIREFPDPDNKIKLRTGFYKEKDEQCRAWFQDVPVDTDYVFCNDADEVHTPENILKLIEYLKKQQPTSVGFKSDSFYGGFDHIIGGFERDHSFKRVLKYIPGCFYLTHRQPTLATGTNIDYAFPIPETYLNSIKPIEGKDITGNQLYDATGITMWHGSYVSPRAVYNKIMYYENAVISKGNCIPDYFNQVFLPWVLHPEQRTAIEDKWNGVQEFMPHARGECKTMPYNGKHPAIIERDMDELQAKFQKELNQFL
jgi:hypothetical protein